jgi:hypothetical protein
MRREPLGSAACNSWWMRSSGTVRAH